MQSYLIEGASKSGSLSVDSGEKFEGDHLKNFLSVARGLWTKLRRFRGVVTAGCLKPF